VPLFANGKRQENMFDVFSTGYSAASQVVSRGVNVGTKRK